MIMPPTGEGMLSLRADKVATASIPTAGRVVSLVLSLSNLVVLALCMRARLSPTRQWKTLPKATVYLLLIYINSFLFIFVTTMMEQVGINNSDAICQGTVLLCVTSYLGTKLLFFLFSVEKAYIVRAGQTPRWKDTFYLLNFSIIILVCGVLMVVAILLRVAYINEHGQCMNGLRLAASIPVIVCDVIINVYLASLFMIPLRQLETYRSKTIPALRAVAIRTLIGTCCTLASSLINLVTLTALKSEEGWICLLACNADVLFTTFVLHWVTANDASSSNLTSEADREAVRVSAASTCISQDDGYANHMNEKQANASIGYVKPDEGDEVKRNKRRSSSPLGYVYHDDSDEYHRNKRLTNIAPDEV